MSLPVIDDATASATLRDAAHRAEVGRWFERARGGRHRVHPYLPARISEPSSAERALAAMFLNAAAWQDRFVHDWRPGSDAHASYLQRIAHGPAYGVHEAIRSEE